MPRTVNVDTYFETDASSINGRVTALEGTLTGGVYTAGGPVATATTANITLSGEQTLDGVLTSASRVLVRAQTDPADNGIYVSAAGAWSRATDMDAAGEVQGTLVYVEGGTTYAGSTFYTGSEVTTLGTDDIVWAEAQAQGGLQTQIDDIETAIEYSIKVFPETDWEPPRVLDYIDLNNPVSGVTSATNITIANAGRFFATPAIADYGLAVGDVVRVAFKKISGSSQPPSFTFRAGTSLVSTVTFSEKAGWYFADATIPATTTIIRIDWTNSTGDDVVIGRPMYAKQAESRDIVVPMRAQFERLVTDTDDLANLWPSDVTTNITVGSGTVTDNGDGSFTVPANTFSQIRGDITPRAVGANITALCRLSTALVRRVQIRFVGDVSGTSFERMQSLGDGWYYFSGAIPTVTGSTSVDAIYFEPDNRDLTAPVLTTGAVTLDKFLIVDGLQIPDTFPAAADFGDTLVVRQSSDTISIAQPAGADTYADWTFTRYNDAATRALGWRISGLGTATRTGETSISAGTALTNDGEFEVAIKEVGKSDFMGGLTHGDMEEDRNIQVFIDGDIVTPDGSTSYEARRVEVIQKSSLWEVDNATDTLTATLVTRWVWEGGTLRLTHRLEWQRSIDITTPYFTMLPCFREVGGTTGGASDLITGTAYLAPEFGTYDISTASHAMPQGNYQRIFTTGEIGVKLDVEIVEGWSAAARSFAEDTADRNKLYFSPYSIGGTTAVTSGDIVDWEAVYRVSVS